MADLPILFSAPMVRAILREIEKPGTGKTQTRRILQPQPYSSESIVSYDPNSGTWMSCEPSPATGGTRQMDPWRQIRIRSGDRLYVREHWRVSRKWDKTAPRDLPEKTMSVYFKAGGFICNLESDDDWRPTAEGDAPEWVGKHRQAMHMPKWASRITLIVEDVKIERLRDISREDAIAEGATSRPNCQGDALDLPGWSMDWSPVSPEGPWANDISLRTPEAAFLNYFHRINDYPGKYGDDHEEWPNPWVVAYTFRPILGNIHQIGGDA